MTLTNGIKMSTKRTNTFEPLLEVIPFHFDNEASFREMLQGLKRPGVTNRLHLHEFDFEAYSSPHDIGGCYDLAVSDLNSYLPSLFSGTYEKNGRTILVFGYVAATQIEAVQPAETPEPLPAWARV